MILNRSVTIQSKVTSYDSEGLAVNTYSTLKSGVKMCIQPNALTKQQMERFGAVDVNSNCKLAFMVKDDTVLELMRVIDGSITYEIIALNPWSFRTNHAELLLNPIQGVRND